MLPALTWVRKLPKTSWKDAFDRGFSNVSSWEKLLITFQSASMLWNYDLDLMILWTNLQNILFIHWKMKLLLDYCCICFKLWQPKMILSTRVSKNRRALRCRYEDNSPRNNSFTLVNFHACLPQARTCHFLTNIIRSISVWCHRKIPTLCHELFDIFHLRVVDYCGCE